MVPVGGGGLISGISVAVKSLNPNIKVYGVQSIGAFSMFYSYAQCYPSKIDKVKTFADGVAVKEVGNLTLDITMKNVNDILLVEEEDIVNAIRYLLSIDKVVEEKAGALPVAAMLKGIVPNITKDSKVVCVISGGNINQDNLIEIISKKQ